MKKNEYSLTSKERKEKKNKNATHKFDDTQMLPNDNATEVDKTTQFDDLTSINRDDSVVSIKRKKSTVFVAVAMVVLLLVAFVVAVLLYDEYNKPQGNPYATITLSDGKKLEFELFEDTAPIAVTNFIFLSMNGFFNETVVHDIQSNWVRFMGMVDYNTHRSQNDDYTKKFKGFDIYDYDWATEEESNVFWYRLKKDTTSRVFSNEEERKGLLCFDYSYGSTLFQISCTDRPELTINNIPREAFTVMGRYKNDATLEYLEELDKTAVEKNGTWLNPEEIITIKKINIKNYDKTKWEGNKWTNKKGILSTFDTYIDSLNGRNNHSSNYTSL